jgi:hypothetical protein
VLTLEESASQRMRNLYSPIYRRFVRAFTWGLSGEESGRVIEQAWRHAVRRYGGVSPSADRLSSAGSSGKADAAPARYQVFACDAKAEGRHLADSDPDVRPVSGSDPLRAFREWSMVRPLRGAIDADGIPGAVVADLVCRGAFP